jgi:hypothetical protein
LKEKTTEQPILVFLEFKKNFQVKCDASGVAIGAVLSQDDNHVAYFSENLNDAEENYSTYDKEFYAIIKALKKWRHYLMSKEFIFYIDNHALQFITRQDKLNQRHAKWVEFMQNFTFITNHINGSANKVTDSLIRRCLIFKDFQVETLGFEHLKEMYQEDTDYKEAYETCENTLLRDRDQWMEYMIQEALLSKGS